MQVSTPYADMRLDDADVAAMKDLQAACCKDTEEDSPFCSRVGCSVVLHAEAVRGVE